ncbi:hypothetical protein Bca52824_085258 [Brassica carinata]|uniref:Uncharacterized protein n=1 Tax=Brassica carinata TaxID=52824 RepID=A0A8X7P6S5_BRACI|nr:hypothetical protein Bca52824_085258 [Brassica carinata]
MASYSPGFVSLLTSQNGEFSTQEESNQTELRTVLEMEDKLNKQKLLEKLLEKSGPLSEMEMSLKLKLISEMLG